MSETIHIHYVFILPETAKQRAVEPTCPDPAQRLNQYMNLPFPEDEGIDRTLSQRRPYPPGPFLTWDGE